MYVCTYGMIEWFVCFAQYNILHITYNIHQGAEEFLKTPEGAKMLKTQEEEEKQDENEEGSGLELLEGTDGKSETMDEEKGVEN